MSTTQNGSRTAIDTYGDVSFTTVLRGYDRRQVDEFVARKRRAERELRAALADAERKLREATERADADAAENARLRAELTASRSPDGFGSRAEKLLRLAESEAAEMRAAAHRESIALIEQAKVAAEQHRHESEQAVIARSRELDQEARRRAAELADREEQAAEQIAAGRAEAERLREAADEAANTLRAEAEAEAELVKARATAEAGRIREGARLEESRVTELRAEVHAELERIERFILGQLGSEPAD